MKNTQSSIKMSFIYSMVYQIFKVLTPIITAPYISRVLGAEGVGIFSYTSSIQSYFLLFAALGTMAYGTREISMNRNNEYVRSKLFWEIELMTVGTSLIAIMGWIVLILLSSTNKLYYMILSIGIFATLFDITWFFNGLECFRLTVMRNVIIKILGIICLFVFVKNASDLSVYVLITMLTTLISSLSLWTYLPKFLVRVRWNELRFKKHFRETLVYFIPSIATSVYTVLDKTLIGLITKKNVENGYYQQAEKIIDTAKSFVFYAINSVLGVRISYLYAEKKYDEILIRIDKSLNYIFFTGCACSFGIAGVAKTFVPLFFGDGYDEVIPLLYIFAPIIIIVGVSNCISCQYYTPCGRRAQSAKFIIVGAFLNLVFNLLLIPNIAAIGAAIASVIAELSITFLYVWFCRDFLDIKILVKAGYKKIVSGFIMFLLVFILNDLDKPNLVRVLIQTTTGAIIYIISLVLMNDGWTKDTLRKVLDKPSVF